MFVRLLNRLFGKDRMNEAELSEDGGSVSRYEEGKTMWLFVGLGNPGAQYERNRHNVGFMAVDAIQAYYSGFDVYRSKFQGKVSEGRIGSTKIVLLKPQTYMNLSGKSVLACAQFYKILPERIIVFHDELDIPPADVRVKLGGGNAGHNGLKSIQQQTGTPDFWRVRIGIGRPEHKGDVSNFVLSDFSKAENVWVESLLDTLARQAQVIVENDPKHYEKSIHVARKA